VSACRYADRPRAAYDAESVVSINPSKGTAEKSEKARREADCWSQSLEAAEANGALEKIGQAHSLSHVRSWLRGLRSDLTLLFAKIVHV